MYLKCITQQNFLNVFFVVPHIHTYIHTCIHACINTLQKALQKRVGVGWGFVNTGPYPPILAGRREEGWGDCCELNGCETNTAGLRVQRLRN